MLKQWKLPALAALIAFLGLCTEILLVYIEQKIYGVDISHFVDNQYIVDLHSSENNLDDDINIRNVMFKMHVRDSEKIESVTINGNNVKFYNHDHHKEAVPFNSTAFALDSKTMNFKFKQDIRKEYQIIIKVK